MRPGVKPKLCIVSPYERGGGAEYQISLLIDALNAAGEFEIHYLAHFLDAADRTRNYHVARVGRGGPVPRLGYLMDAASLYGRLREIDPCVIYQRVACAYTGICALYARHRSVPMLWHVAHDNDVTPEVNDMSRNIVRLRLEKWAAALGARYATRIIVQTQHQAELLQRNFARCADVIVPNFHPPAIETIDKFGPVTVIWIANLKPSKCPEAFVDLAESLNEFAGIRFVMVGAPVAKSGGRRWSGPLMRRIEATKNLQYLGQKSQAEVNELLGRAHIFVNTSAQEGFPNTFIQAWQRDVAVVSLSVDPDGVLEQQEVGIVAHSQAGLVAAVRTLVGHSDVRSAFVERGRKHAAGHHSMRNAQELVALIDRFRDRANSRP